MKHGSLFSGIGGFDLAAEWMGWQNIFHCEWNEFGQKVLKYYWPNAESFSDITKTDFTKYANKIDILTGGFPCQPYSHSGKRLGKADDRHLWPEMLRAIQEIQPPWVVGENVSGLVSWNGGMVFNEVQADLESEGYEVIPFILPACAVNAPHRRDRVWFVAYSNGTKQKNNIGANFETEREIWGQQKSNVSGKLCSIRDATNSTSSGLERRMQNGQRFGTKAFSYTGEWRPISKPTLRAGNDGIPDRLDGVAFSKWRNESIKAAGNAIVPQVAFQIFQAINNFQSLL